MSLCIDNLPDNWDQVGLDCSSLGIVESAVELLAENLCSIQCSLSHITTTSDCSLEPSDFDTLFPACFEIPDFAVVIQSCSCSQGGMKIWAYDPDTEDWVRLGISFKVGAASDFVDPNNPTDAELLALFGGFPQNDVLVNIRPTREFFASSNCGSTWYQVNDVPPIGADVQQTPGVSVFVDGQVGVTEIFNDTIYTNGSTSSFPIAVGDLIDISITYGYKIDRFPENVSGPNDNAEFKFRLSGPFATTTEFNGTPTGLIPISNGLAYVTYNSKRRATIAADLSLKLDVVLSGDAPPPGDENWQWTAYLARASVSVQRA